MKYENEARFFSVASDEDLRPVEGEARIRPAKEKGKRIALIGCFRPRQCGIATFTADTYDHLRAARTDLSVDVYALRAHPAQAVGDEAVFAIDERDAETYRDAADRINASGASAVWLQHEFGIFGGDSGSMVLELVDRIAAPLIVTLHTILAEPSDAQRLVMDRLVARALKLIVMSALGRDTLVGVYGADPEQVALIEHGTPDRPFVDISPLREALGLADRPILSTFGLIGPGKGLEAAIRALPAIAAQYPDILYRIVGATHPNLVAAEGEAYRQSLEELAESLGVSANIAWENRFLDTGDLLDQIEVCDIYLAPYPNLQQITSGTLAYAVALGRAVVSTPFVHARELLADDVGILLPGCDSEAIAEAVLLLLAVPEERRALQGRAYARGRSTAWGVIAKAFAALIDDVVVAASEPASPRRAPALSGVWDLCDDVGIFQHSCHLVPDRDHGYCIDDNARALMLVHALPARDQRDAGRRALTFASFIQHGWNEERRSFRNFMGYDRRWLEEEGSEDSNGRTLWALGHASSRAHSPAMREWAAEWFDRTAVVADALKSPRAIAFALLGADERLEANSENIRARAIVERGGAFLGALWKTSRRAGWDWLEAGLAYDNARLAEALIRAGRRLPSLPLEQAGLSALDWLCARQTAPEGHFRPAGSDGFFHHGESFPFDQQPLEAWATIDACASAFEATGSRVWRQHAENAFAWFLGQNDRGLALGDAAGGRCLDGLNPRGVNRNSGAESTLAFHLAYRAMASGFWREQIAEPAAARRGVPPEVGALAG
ncbi:glycosyltransferase involved in cell wall biosynthesis [Sphingopyxis sp. OAS728]|uniref:glycosyltransferase family 4 protein n=1 Tax=Sphingopyxis sp. OAS728 TaxID=2663823 RepID=UPI00178B5709|nr:glycosyltransferase family 4 protein [Sphingopyxis sp. OAS728]MBE1529464.1 glycosyltransferase involved in cell wall biosynthesis [Sphingopyxis sp. OAS728]